jgi:hypothetical protein
MEPIYFIKPIPFTEFPSSFNLGPKLAKAPTPGTTVKSPPETPLLHGTPKFFVNLPAPLYIPHVNMNVVIAYTVSGFKIRSPVDGFIPLLAHIAPNLANSSTFTTIEHI